MTTYDDAAISPARARGARFRTRDPRDFAIGLIFWGVVVGVGIYWCVVWAQGGADAPLRWGTTTQIFLNIGRITALLSGYLALVEVLLLARLPFVERAIGFDRLTNWHRWNGFAVLWLVLAHVVFSVWGFARNDFPPTIVDERVLVDDDQRVLSGDHHRHDRHGPGDRGGRHLARGRAQKVELRGLVRDSLHRVRRDRARVVPRDPGRQRAHAERAGDCRRHLACHVRGDARAAPLVPPDLADHPELALPDEDHRGRRGGAGDLVGANRRPWARAVRRACGSVLLLAVPDERASGTRSIRFRSRRRRRAVRSGSRSRRSATTLRSSGSSRSERPCLRRDRSVSSPPTRPRAARCC